MARALCLFVSSDWSDLPEAVLAVVAGEGRVVAVEEEFLTGGTGPANKAVTLMRFQVESQGDRHRVSLVRKTLQPVQSSRHAELAGDPRHWAWWRRESEAYRSGLLPTGGTLRAPHCPAVDGDDIYLEYVEGPPPTAAQAARALAGWQVDYHAELDRPWLARGQLGQRLAVSALDWSGLGADPRAIELWDAREDYGEVLEALPVVRSHGDFSLGNLRQVGPGLVVLDWASFGWEPLGFDLAHLALSCGEDPTGAYLECCPARDARQVLAGFGASVAIIGASRVHWMLSAGIEVPAWYVEFLWAHRPR